jgi:hypothetical protein
MLLNCHSIIWPRSCYSHLQHSPFFFYFLLEGSYSIEPLVDSFLLLLPLLLIWVPPLARAAFCCLSLIYLEMWKNVSFTLWPDLALVSKKAIPNSLAKAIPYSVSMTFLSVKSALFPMRIFSTFELAWTSIYLTQFLTLLKLSSEVQS